MAIPLVLPESTVKAFKFYRDSNIYEGMMYGGMFYKLDSSFDLIKCNESFHLAKQLAEEYNVVLTTGMFYHRVWVEVE